MTARRLTTALLLSACVAAPVSAQSGSSSRLLAPFRAVIARAHESTVRVRCDDKDAVLGTIISPDGLILTKASELRGAISVLLPDGTAYDVEVVAQHKATDLALLKLDVKKADLRHLKAITFADSKKIPVGNWLAAAGTSSDPIGVGIVSVMTRTLSGLDATDTLNNNRGFLGIILSPEDDPDGGARIDTVSPKSGADKAGLKKGDIIRMVNGKKVAGLTELRETLSNYRPGDKVTLKVKRNDEEMELKATLGKISTPSRSDIQNSMGGQLSGRRTGFPAILQTDLVIDPKNCGGPIVDLDGNVLGIIIARAGRVETWVLPSETIRPVLAEMKAGKHAVSTTAPKKDESKNEK